MGIINWLARAQDEGQDSFGAFELTLGGAVLVGYLLAALFDGAVAPLVVLLAAALWYGHRLERAWLTQLGRRYVRGTLSLRLTWLTLAHALGWAVLLLVLAHLRAWSLLPGWANGPILLLLVLGIYYLTMGWKLGVGRWLVLGGWLVLLAVLLPGVRPLREHFYAATSFFAGVALLLSAFRAREAYRLARERTGV